MFWVCGYCLHIKVNLFWRSVIELELHSLCFSPNIVRVIKSRTLRCVGHVARMEEGRSSFKILTGKNAGKRPRKSLKVIGVGTRN